MIRNLVLRVWKLRQRFGIAAPRVAIHSQIPWYWRWIGIAVLLGISAASAAWIYDAGRRFAGFDRSEVQEELRATRSALEDARAELNTLSIYRFKVEPDVLPGEYRYRLLLLTPTTRQGRDFNGRLELLVNLTEGGQSAIMSFPEPGDAGAAAFRLAFKYFRRVEGTFRVSPKARVESVQVRVYELGSNQPRATLSVSL